MLETSKNEKNGRFLLLLRAVFFGILLAGPSLLETFYYENPSDLVFSDLDEIVYLTLPFTAAERRPANALYIEKDVPIGLQNVLTELPSAPLDFVIGSIAANIGLTPASLGASLDFLISVIAYILFRSFFLRLTSSNLFAECTTILFLSAPWFLSPHNLSLIDYSQFEHFSSPSNVNHVTVPVLRALHTQLSYIPFGIALTILLSLGENSNRWKSMVWLGLAVGSTSYFYVFGWLSSLAVCSVVLLLQSLPRETENENPRTRILQLGLFLLVQSVISLPSLLLSLGVSSRLSDSGLGGDALREIWYFSFEMAAIFLVALAFYFFSRSSNEKRNRALRLLVAITASDLVLMNTQAITGAFIVPIHFIVFYINPLLMGVFIAMILESVGSIPRFRQKVSVLVMAIVALALTGAARKIVSLPERRNAELAEVVGYMESNLEQSDVLAWLPYSHPFESRSRPWHLRSEGNILATLTNTHLLFQIWQANILLDSQEAAARELLSGWIFSGATQLISACPKKIDVLSKNMYFQQWISMQTSRNKLCEATAEFRQTISACDLRERFKVDFVLQLPELTPNLSAPMVRFGSKVWGSSEGTYQLYRFNQKQAIAACHEREL